MPETIYPSTAVTSTHPARLASFAIAHGLSAGFSERFTYLELGCGDASNLLPLASQFPSATFVGVDRDASAIARGDDLRRAAGLDNIALHAANLLDFEPGARFDYVVAHGVYSWVAPAVQRRILALGAASLAPAGVFYLSYNTLPGWGVRGAVRDVMRMGAGHATGDAARLRGAKSALARLARHGVGDKHPWGALLAAEIGLLDSKPDGYLLGEYLAEHNEPLLFADLASRAREHGLRYLAEALPASPDGALEASVLADLLASGLSRVDAEQHLDMVAYRQFRGTLLCHDGAAIADRADLGALADHGFFAGRLEPQSQEPLLGPGRSLAFRAGTGAVIEVDRPLFKAALLVLSMAWPRGLRAAELVSAALGALQERALLDQCGVDLHEIERTTRHLVTLVERRQIELLPWTPQPCRDPRAIPFAPPLLRLEAARRRTITSPRHEPTALDDPSRIVLSLADGARDAAAITREVGLFIDGGDLPLTPAERAALAPHEARASLVALALARLRAHGLFETPPKTPAQLTTS